MPEFHQLARLIPEMDLNEIHTLTEDVRLNGLLEPIVLYEGKILDGRHRYKACGFTGVAPRYEEFTGSDPISYVLSKNLHRRHLTSAQKAAIAVEALPLLERQAQERQVSLAGTRPTSQTYSADLSQKIGKGRSTEEAAQLTGSNRQYVSDAKRIADSAPEVFEAMKNNQVSIPEAKALSQKSEPERAQILTSLPTMSKSERREVFRQPKPEPATADSIAERDPAVENTGEEMETDSDSDPDYDSMEELTEGDPPEGDPPEDDPPEDDIVPASNNLAIHFSSDSPEWYTPPVVLEKVVACLGEIDLDPCSNTSHTVPATAHFTAADGGLEGVWAGRVFMNPPYGREIDQWIEKLVEEFEFGHVTQALALVPARVDTAWFRRLAAFPVAFWRGRITFIGPDGSGNPAPFPSAIIALGIPVEDFATAFAEVADVYVPFHQKE